MWLEGPWSLWQGGAEGVNTLSSLLWPLPGPPHREPEDRVSFTTPPPTGAAWLALDTAGPTHCPAPSSVAGTHWGKTEQAQPPHRGGVGITHGSPNTAGKPASAVVRPVCFQAQASQLEAPAEKHPGMPNKSLDPTADPKSGTVGINSCLGKFHPKPRFGDGVLAEQRWLCD